MASTEIPVIMRFLAETRGVEEGAKKVKDATADSVTELQTLADAAGRVAQDAVRQVYEAYDGLKVQMIQGVAAGVAAVAGATSLGLTAMGRSSVDAASGFEDLRARIQGMTGDAQAAAAIFAEGLEFTAKTPFQVESIEAAVATLEAFGVGGKKNLELVANIAAASGGRLEEVAVRVSKALTGNAQGFQGLRDTAGVTGERLARFGAVLSDTGNVSLQTKEEIEAAVTALQAFGSQELGGSIELLSQTYRGALNNAGNAVKLFKATVGEAFLPTLTALVQGFAAGTNAAAKLIAPFSGVIAVMGTLTAAGAAATGAVAALVIPFAGVIAKALLVRKALALASAAALQMGASSTMLAATQAQVVALSRALGGMSARLGVFLASTQTFATVGVARLASGLALVQGALQKVIASPITPWMVGLTAATGLATVAINRYLSAQEALGRTLQANSSRLTAATTGFRSYAGLLSEISGTDFSFGLDASVTANELGKALKDLSAVDLAAALRANGLGLKELESDLAENRRGADLARAELVALNEAAASARNGVINVTAQSASTRAVLQGLFGKRSQVDLAAVQGRLQEVNLEFGLLGQGATLLRGLIDKLGVIPTALEDAATQASALGNFLSFANRLEGVDHLNRALNESNQQMQALEANLLTALGTLDRFTLTRRLGDSGLSDEEANTIKAYLGLLDSRANLEKKISDDLEQSKRREVEAYELVTERRKTLGDLSLAEERERIQAQLAWVEQGTAEELAIIKRLAAVDEEIRRDRVKVARDLMNEQMDAVRDALQEGSADPGTTNTQIAGDLRGAIKQLEQFRRANQSAFREAPEEAARFTREIVNMERELKRVDARVLVDQFTALQKELQSGITTRSTATQQLAQVGSALETLKRALASGTIDIARGEEYLAELEEKKLDLTRKQTDEKLKQAGEVETLQQRALEEELRILELRKEAGEKVDRELKESRELLLNVKLAAIEKERQAAIDADADVVLANEKALLERERVLREAAVDAFRRQGQEASATSGVREQISGSRGRTSRRSQESKPARGARARNREAAYQFELPDFADGFGMKRQRSAPKAPKFEDVRRRITEQVRTGASSPIDLDQSQQASPTPTTQTTTVTNNVQIVLETGEKISLGGADADKIMQVVKANQRKTEYYDPQAAMGAV